MSGPTRLTSTSSNPFTSKPQKKNPTRLEYSLSKQEQFIEDRGIEVLWEKSFICPCLSVMTRSPKHDCPICKGRGVAYLPAEEVRMALQSQDRSVSNTDLGVYDSGTAIATTAPNSTITFRDRLSLPYVPIEQSMLIQVTERRIEEGFQLPYDVHRIIFARTEERELTPNVDFKIDLEENKIYPNEDLVGQNISINISTTLRYIVIDLLKESRYQYTKKGTGLEQFDQLPRKLMLKREDAWVDPIPQPIEEDYKTEVEQEGAWEDPKREMSGGFFGGGL